MALNPVRNPLASAVLRRLRAALAIAAAPLVLAACAVQPAAEPLAPSLREEVITLSVPERPDLTLETTLFKPPGDGPFPLIIINHGKSPGDPRFQPRARFLAAGREFVSRGYAVATPMRRGFADSSGREVLRGCDILDNGIAQADDVQIALIALSKRPDIDARRVVVMGQSHGGLATVALGARNLPQVAGLVNFSGGLRVESCGGWQRELEKAMGAYGRKSRAPSLWFYGDNDSYFSVDTWQAMYKSYTDAGGVARLIDYGKFRDDAHKMFGSNAGLPIWLPPMRDFFHQLGLPFDVRYRITFVEHDAPTPPASGFAPVDDAGKLPFVDDKSRASYATWLDLPPPRAFAIGEGGAWGSSSGDPAAMRKALERCNARRPMSPCRLYAVDDDVTWTVAPVAAANAPRPASPQ